MNDAISIHELRRRAPLHFWAKADNARFSAFLLWNMAQGDHKQHALDIGYNGGPETALSESFRRESSITLELIIKSVITQQIECGLSEDGRTKARATHDLTALWVDAKLPNLSLRDQRRLVVATQILYWSGRYAAPLKDSDLTKEQAVLAKFDDRPKKGPLHSKIVYPESFSWEDIDRIYQVCLRSLSEIRKNCLP